MNDDRLAVVIVAAEQRGFLRGLFAGVMLAVGIYFAWKAVLP